MQNAPPLFEVLDREGKVWPRVAAIAVSGLALLGTPLCAQTEQLNAVVNTADLALPGAQEVIVDVRSALYGARYQEGAVKGWRYLLFPDGSARVIQDGAPPHVQFAVKCTTEQSCEVLRPDGSRFDVTASGDGRPSQPAEVTGDTLSRYLAQWVLAGPDAPPAAAQPDAPAPPAEVAKVEPVAEPPTVQTESAPAAPPAPETTEVALAQPEVEALPVSELPVSELPEPELPDSELQEATGPDPVCAEPDPIMPDTCIQASEPVAPSLPVPEAEPTQTAAAPSQTPRKPAPLTLKGPIAVAATPSRPQPAKKAAPKTFFERMAISCSVTATSGLAFIDAGDTGKPRVSLGCSSKLSEKLSLRLSFVRYFTASEQTVDDPDFTYAFTYKATKDLSFSYSNYGAQFGGPNGGLLKSLADGNLRGNYRLPQITLPNQKTANCSAGLGLPNPLDENFSLSCGYAVTDKLRVGVTANLYMPDKQGDYDPDYTYTASYRPAKDWLISYGNYSNNRWRWNRGKDPGPGITGGSLSVTYSFKF